MKQLLDKKKKITNRKKNATVFLLALSFLLVGFTARGGEHTIIKSSNDPIRIPATFAAGDRLVITGDSLETTDWTVFKRIESPFELQVETPNKEIPDRAFWGSSELASAIFPKVTTIGAYAFGSCSQLKVLVMPAVPPGSVGANTFQNVSPLLLIVDDADGYTDEVMEDYPDESEVFTQTVTMQTDMFEPGSSIRLEPGRTPSDHFSGTYSWTKDGAVLSDADQTTYSATQEGIYKLFYMLEGHTIELYSMRLVKREPEPEPEPVWYQVVMPQVEGVVSILPGTSYVKEGDDFVFTVVPEDSYIGRELHVSTSRRLLPDSEGVEVVTHPNGHFVVTIRDVRETVYITLAFEEVPTGVAQIADGNRVWTAPGYLYVCTGTPATLSVYSVSGSLVKQSTVAVGETVAIPLPCGIYLVRVDIKTYKVVVR